MSANGSILVMLTLTGRSCCTAPVQFARCRRDGQLWHGLEQVAGASRSLAGLAKQALTTPDISVQFFITYAKQPSLDGKYTIFGRVIDGSDSTLDAMEREPVNAKNRPLHEIKLESVTIHANPVRFSEPTDLSLAQPRLTTPPACPRPLMQLASQALYK
jgi:hypothetical protein